MLVLTLTDCPPGLRGDLTKWLFEISAGVFVGQVSARVRENIWKRTQDLCRDGRAVMVFSAAGEQRLDFKVYGDTWEPIDFDGIKLMLRPTPARIKHRETLKPGFSKAAARRAAQRFAQPQKTSRYPLSYVVVDIETTGFDALSDEMISLSALKTDNGVIAAFSALIRANQPIPPRITELTGITGEALRENGRELPAVMTDLLAFIGKLPIVAHNVGFDQGFLRSACAKCSLSLLSNRMIDTLALSRSAVKGLRDYKLATLAAHFGLTPDLPHRSLGDCSVTGQLYEKLINLAASK
jgi:CRISPR-associated protein Cas2